jgi:hypothetical protein
MDVARAGLRGVLRHAGRGSETVSLELAGRVAEPKVTLRDTPKEDRFTASRAFRHGR